MDTSHAASDNKIMPAFSSDISTSTVMSGDEVGA